MHAEKLSPVHLEVNLALVVEQKDIDAEDGNLVVRTTVHLRRINALFAYRT